MTTCTWNFRRHAGRVTAVALCAALTSGLVLPRASADQISDLKAQAAAISARIQALGNQEEALSERYDQAQLAVQTLQQQVAAAGAQLAAARATTDKARQALKADAVQAYLDGGNSPLASGTGTVQSATDGLLRAEYVNTLATNQSDAVDQYRTAALQEQAAQSALKKQQSAAEAQLRQVEADRSAVQSTADQLTATEHQVTGQIATLVAQQQAAEAAAAAAAARQRAAAEAAQAAAEAAARQQAAAAAAAASQLAAAPTGGGATLSAAPAVSSPPPPVGSGASGAVAAAESRVGDWYQWGATGPNTFDCSGLVMWAYAQVGISLPHFSGAQYADTTHIPMSDLQPGDLVFFSDPGEHVAMYVGNGEIIEAPHTGAQVHIIPMYSEFTLAGRVG